MKKTINTMIFTALAVSICLCGVYFFAVKESKDITPAGTDSISETIKYEDFSIEDAKKYLKLCSKSYSEEDLGEELQSLGYTDYRYVVRNQYTESGSGIGFGIGAKEYPEYTQVILVIRGTYKGEWYSNFEIGEGETHEGFRKATEYVDETLSEYIAANCLSEKPLHIICTGHSRGGAVANLTAKSLIIKGEFSGVTAYTFASPNTTTDTDAHSDLFRGIYNIQNSEDFICYIPLEKWGYTKYGNVLTLPTESTCENYDELYALMQEDFYTITGYNHTGYPYGNSDINIFLSSAYSLAPTIEDYYTKEYTLSPYRLTLSDFMLKVAALLSGDDTLANGMFLISSGSSPVFSPLTEFMLEGITLEDVAVSGDITASAISCGHTYETYEAWFNVLDEAYFYKALNKPLLRGNSV